MIDENEIYMVVCQSMARKSHCISKQVACVAVKDGRIITSGINGTVPGHKNCDSCFEDLEFTREEHHQWSLLHEIHAEINMISYCAKVGISLEGAILYSTLQPCSDCSKALAVCGIKEIIYLNEYEHTPVESKAVLSGIKVTKFNG